MTEGGRGRSSCVPKFGTCCCLLPLDVGVKLIAFAELVVCSGLFLYTLVEITRGEPAFSIANTPPGDALYLHYTSLVDVIFAIFLLTGIYFRKPHYAKFWSLAQSTHLAVSILITVYRFLFAQQTVGRTDFLRQLLEFICSTALDGYFILVVYSYYQECRKFSRDSERLPDAGIV